MRKRLQPEIQFVLLAVILLLAFSRLAPRLASAALSAPSYGERSATNASVPQQYPIMDKIADKIIQKYQNSSCLELYQEKAQKQGQPKSVEEQRAIAVLHNDAQMRQAFINKIAAPIANKMFECGMIP